MRKAFCLTAALLLLAMAVPAVAGQPPRQVTMAPMGRAYSPPPLGRKQGWVVISNRDWVDYTLNIDYKSEKLYLYRQGQGWGSVHLPSGSTITLALEKDTWDLYGNSSGRLKVRVREGRTTTVSLEPFGYVGNTGLVGVSNDGGDVRRETLFDIYNPPVVVAPPPPTVIVEQPPPPPVIITRPPRYVAPPPVIVVPPPRPVVVAPPPPPPVIVAPPPPPPRRGWGFSLFFD